ncbi:MAG: DUF3325 family protein [Roseateles sp.]|uniref:DUF3325 family protein n=1 Tax=Roseateles sp. TaxID=1971397 RepID=UPI0039EB77B2
MIPALALLALCTAGMLCLALAMDRHAPTAWRHRLLRPALRLAALAQLAAALAIACQAWGASVGVVVWTGFLSAGAGLVVALLARRR